MPSTAEKVATVDKTVKASDHIARTIINEIKNGNFPVDTMLPTERELCDRFNTSRPTIREALTQVQLRGFASMGTGKRPRVTKPSLESILLSAGAGIRDLQGNSENRAHLEQMRQFIEAGAVREAAKRGDNIHITRLFEALERNNEAIGKDDFPETDIAFHRCIVSVVGNPIILKLHDFFVASMIANRPPKTDPMKHDKLSYNEHREIYEAILNRHENSATELIDQHLARSYRARLKVT